MTGEPTKLLEEFELRGDWIKLVFEDYPVGGGHVSWFGAGQSGLESRPEVTRGRRVWRQSMVS